jgi:hypothetical protein
MASKYPATSPYATTASAGWYLGLYKHRAVPVDSADREVTITIKYHLRPDLLSYDLYGTPVYWWVFLVRNMNVIRDPIWDFTEGKTIMVPSVNHLRSVVG